MLARVASLFGIGLLALSSAARAEDDPVVVRLGDSALRVSDVTRRLAALPAFQRATLGQTTDEIKKRFVETVLVPEMRYAAEAHARKLDVDTALRAPMRDVLRRALVESIRQDATTAGVEDAAVRAYYDAHHEDYQRPERIRVFRILVDDDALARKIIEDAKGAGGPERWSRLAREHSVDEATKLRSGALGFVYPDGRTEVPQLTVDPALYAAASRVRDGEIVQEPVHEGKHLAVVWRRGTLPKLDRTATTEHDAITAILVKQRVEGTVAMLLADARKRDVKDEDPAPLDALPKERSMAPSEERRDAPSQTVVPVPSATERGLR